MLIEKNECIATKGFGALILDYEFPACDGLPAFVSGRVLIEDLCMAKVHAESRDALINLFLSGAWKEAR